MSYAFFNKTYIHINNYLTDMSQILPIGNIPSFPWLCTNLFFHLIKYAVELTLWRLEFGRYLLWHNMPVLNMLTWFVNIIMQNFLQITLVNQTSLYWAGVIEVVPNPVDPHKLHCCKSTCCISNWETHICSGLDKLLSVHQVVLSFTHVHAANSWHLNIYSGFVHIFPTISWSPVPLNGCGGAGTYSCIPIQPQGQKAQAMSSSSSWLIAHNPDYPLVLIHCYWMYIFCDIWKSGLDYI